MISDTSTHDHDRTEVILGCILSLVRCLSLSLSLSERHVYMYTCTPLRKSARVGSTKFVKTNGLFSYFFYTGTSKNLFANFGWPHSIGLADCGGVLLCSWLLVSRPKLTVDKKETKTLFLYNKEFLLVFPIEDSIF